MPIKVTTINYRGYLSDLVARKIERTIYDSVKKTKILLPNIDNFDIVVLPIIDPLGKRLPATGFANSKNSMILKIRANHPDFDMPIFYEGVSTPVPHEITHERNC